MSRDTILHLFSAAPNLSPFDVNMAIDAGWQHCIPYTGLEPQQIAALTQDAIFSRGPSGVKRTGIFIGGRDIHIAMAMLEQARVAMVPPFEVSVFADPSGAFTTAAGMVACIERHFHRQNSASLAGARAVVFGGTGPVGMCCAMLLAQSGADAVIVSHESLARADAAAAECSRRYGLSLRGADGSDDERIVALLADADIVCSAAKAGIQVLASRHLRMAGSASVLCDVNAVPPEGIAGVDLRDDGVVVDTTPGGALGVGALAVGQVKYRTQQALLQQMIEHERPLYLDFRQALEMARAQI